MPTGTVLGQVVKWVGLVRTDKAKTMDGVPRLLSVKFIRHGKCALDSFCGSSAWRMRGKMPHSARRMPLQRPVGAMLVPNEFHRVIPADSPADSPTDSPGGFFRQNSRTDSPREFPADSPSKFPGRSSRQNTRTDSPIRFSNQIPQQNPRSNFPSKCPRRILSNFPSKFP